MLYEVLTGPFPCLLLSVEASAILVHCACRAFFSRKDGPYTWTLDFGQVKEALSPRNFKDWFDWGMAKTKLKVALQCMPDYYYCYWYCYCYCYYYYYYYCYYYYYYMLLVLI